MASSSQAVAAAAAADRPGPEQAIDLEGLCHLLQHDPLDAGRKAGRTIVDKLYVEKFLEKCDDKHKAIRLLRDTLEGADLRWLCKEYYQVWGESCRTLTIGCAVVTEEKLSRLLKRCCNTKNVTCVRIRGSQYRSKRPASALPCWVPVIRLSEVLSQLCEVDLSAPGCFQLLHVITMAPSSAPGAAAAPSRAAPTGLAGRLQVLSLSDGEYVVGKGSWSQLGKLTALRGLSLGCKRIADLAKGYKKVAAASRQLQALSKLTLTTKEKCSKELLRALLSGLGQQLNSLELLGASANDIGDDPNVLAGLKQLKELRAEGDLRPAAVVGSAGNLVVVNLEEFFGDVDDTTMAELLDRADSLQELLLPDEIQLSSAAAAAVFRHGSLSRLRAGYIDCGPEWRDVVLEDSQLEELECKWVGPTELQPDPFANLPVFPKLRKFCATIQYPEPGQQAADEAADLQLGSSHRFLGIQRAIHNHSSMLEKLMVDITQTYKGDEPVWYDEPLPASLPKLTYLELDRIGTHVLAALPLCHLPRLEEMRLELSEMDGTRRPLVLGDLSWLLQLPSLTCLEVYGVPDDEELLDELEGLTPEHFNHAMFEPDN